MRFRNEPFPPSARFLAQLRVAAAVHRQLVCGHQASNTGRTPVSIPLTGSARRKTRGHSYSLGSSSTVPGGALARPQRPRIALNSQTPGHSHTRPPGAALFPPARNFRRRTSTASPRHRRTLRPQDLCMPALRKTRSNSQHRVRRGRGPVSSSLSASFFVSTCTSVDARVCYCAHAYYTCTRAPTRRHSKTQVGAWYQRLKPPSCDPAQNHSSEDMATQSIDAECPRKIR